MEILITLNKFQSLHRCCNKINFGLKFNSAIEGLLYDVNPIVYKYEDDTLKLVSYNFSLSSINNNDLKFEVELDKLKNKEIEIFVQGYSIDNIAKGIENITMQKKVDIKNFIKNKATPLSNDGLIFEYTGFGYTYKIILKENLLTIKKEVLTPELNSKRKISNDISILSRIQIDDYLDFDVKDKSFIYVIKQLEKKKIPYNLKVEVTYITGHCIETELLTITTPEYELVFHYNSFLELHVSKNIIDKCFYFTSQNIKYSLSDILTKEIKNRKHVQQIEGYGADDAWHKININKGKYVYSLGYNI